MKRIDRLFWIGAVTAGLFLLFFPALSKYLELKRAEEKLSAEVQDLEKKIHDLEKEQYLIRNDTEHLEQLIREELKLVKPGEVVYKLIPEEAAAVKSDKANPNVAPTSRPTVFPAKKT